MQRQSIVLIGVIGFMILLAGCGVSEENQQTNESAHSENNTENSSSSMGDSGAAENLAPTQPAPAAPTDPYANIIHTDHPNESAYSYWAVDCKTGVYTTSMDSPNVGSGCNNWATNYLERPHNQAADRYDPHLDITQFQMGKDADWLYANISTFRMEGVSSILNGSYALELDFDFDGNGDLLILVNDPSQHASGEWKTANLQVWQDTNKDIGSDTPVFADDENISDGYETLLFDQGLGADPDLAWVRLMPNDPSTVEFAFKRSLLPDGVGAFLWWTWASQQPLDPALFDYVDTYESDEVYQIENSCRWIFDGPSRPLTNICYYKEPEAAEPDRNVCVQPPDPGGSYWDPDACQWVIYN